MTSDAQARVWQLATATPDAAPKSGTFHIRDRYGQVQKKRKDK
jgi:hypothetical protein